MTAAPIPFSLLACDVFREELERLAGDPPPWRAVTYVEMGLHDQPDRLRARLQETIDAWDDPHEGLAAIVLAYGLCGTGLAGVQARSRPLVVPRVHDCIALFLGGNERHAAVLKENPGAYFYSPGWVREGRVPGPDREAALRRDFAGRYADDPEMIEDLVEADRETFAANDCVAYVDLTRNQEAEAYSRRCADCLGWRFRRLAGDSGFLRQLLEGPWRDDRFLTVPPGRRIRLTGEERVIDVDD